MTAEEMTRYEGALKSGPKLTNGMPGYSGSASEIRWGCKRDGTRLGVL